ncbi:MAG: hypothetical protein M3P26_07360 [Gemmatimonadota bacterium]|nr:hypothetical protein [Gemmatimonadota bacterium]
MTLRGEIERIQAAIAAGQFANEASVCTGIVLPILQELGWPVFDPLVVSPEYTLEGRRVDYALCHPKSKPSVFIEVKQPGKSEGADRQLFEYAFHIGVPIAILTDGREWSFYLPAGQGQYHERRFYRLDLVDRDPVESEQRLRRYLGYSAISSGEGRKAANEDYEGVRRNREINETIPLAWRKLLEDQDPILVDLLVDQVETLCGFKPDVDSVAHFISERVRAGIHSNQLPHKDSAPRATVPHRPDTPKRETRSITNASVGFMLNGVHTKTKSAIDTLIQLLRQLATLDTTFLERFAALPRHGRSRRFVARTARELYPDREDLARDYTHELTPGWWVGTNYGSDQIEKIIKMACDVAGLRYGSQLTVDLPRRDKSV